MTASQLEQRTAEYVVRVDGIDYRPGELISTEDLGDRPALRITLDKR